MLNSKIKHGKGRGIKSHILPPWFGFERSSPEVPVFYHIRAIQYQTTLYDLLSSVKLSVLPVVGLVGSAPLRNILVSSVFICANHVSLGGIISEVVRSLFLC